MCGAYRIAENASLTNLLGLFGVSAQLSPGWRNCGQQIDLIVQQDDQPMLKPAMWWLLLEQKDGKYKPSRYTTFNSRWHSGKGFGRASAGPFKYSRCIIPASGFVESGPNKRYWYLEPENRPIAFGGLYRTWQTDAEPLLSCSIITIPPHPAMMNIHDKAMPLMLPVDQPDVLNKWLDPQVTDTGEFEPLMQPALRADHRVYELEKWGSFSPKPGTEPFRLPADPQDTGSNRF